MSCHQGIESAGKGHALACSVCHLLPKDRGRALQDHSEILDNPADLNVAEKICAPCHQKELEAFQSGLHLSLAGMINQTRYLFGAQERAYPPIFGAGGALKPLPPSTSSPEQPAGLVDDLLRRKCLRCHVSAVGAEKYPPYRGRGCAACHVLYASDGKYHGQDKALDQSAKGSPKVHGLTSNIPDSQCLKCHRPNYVGSDAHGLFERDYDSFFQKAVLGKDSVQEHPQGPFHVLSRDIHIEKGLKCLDCHSQEDVMGDGRLAGFALDSPGTTCRDCHGGFEEQGPDTEVDGLKRQGENWIFAARNGTAKRVPLFAANTPSHNPQNHSRLRCSACHARWTAHDYGLSLQRQDGGDFEVWTYLLRQGDSRLFQELERLLAYPKQKPVARDLLSGKKKTGIWLKGYRFRRWENLVLGVDHRNRISLMRPLHQYQISYVDARGKVVLDSVIPHRAGGRELGWAFMPFVPHTTAPRGRPCETCHGNTMAAGRGLSWMEELKAGPDFALLRPQSPPLSGMRLLNESEQRRLLNPDSSYGLKTFEQKKILLRPLDSVMNSSLGIQTQIRDHEWPESSASQKPGVGKP